MSKEFDNFRKKKIFEKEYSEYILRMRENEKKDKVYYDGILAFEVADDEKNDRIIFSIPDGSMGPLKLNPTELSKNPQSPRKKNPYIERIVEIWQGIKCLFDFQLSKISFELAAKPTNSDEYEERLKLFHEYANKYKGYFDFENVKKQIIEQLPKAEKDRKRITIEFEELLSTEKNATVRQIIMIQYYFIKFMKMKLNEKPNRNTIVKDTIRNHNFHLKAIPKVKHRYPKKERFLCNMKLAIDKYEGKDELEKKYQHKFMIYDFNKYKDIFKDNLYQFEQEYYILEGEAVGKYKDSKMDGTNGRIDSVFARIENNVLTDIYLIELKVNDSVIDKAPGVREHLRDIRNIMKNDEIYEYFFDSLYKNIKYRREHYDGIPNLEIRSDFKVHFYTVIGFTNTSFVESVESRLDRLKKDTDLLSLVAELKNVDVQLFFDENIWNPKAEILKTNLISKTKKYFE